MKIRVLFFAQLKDIFGAGETVLECPENALVKEAVFLLLKQKGFSSLPVAALKYAVNENFENPDKKLRAGDVLALMTPVSGG
jgi:molybdopterin converting factor small subunit